MSGMRWCRTKSLPVPLSPAGLLLISSGVEAPKKPCGGGGGRMMLSIGAWSSARHAAAHLCADGDQVVAVDALRVRRHLGEPRLAQETRRLSVAAHERDLARAQRTCSVSPEGSAGTRGSFMRS